MRFDLPLTAPWIEERRDSLTVWRRPDAGILIEVNPVAPLPPDREAWGHRVLFRNLPPGGSVAQTDIVDTKNKKGWPATIVTTVIKDAAGAGVEARLSVFYELVYFGVTIACRIPPAAVARWESELRESVLDAILSAAPVFGGGAVIARVGELFEMTPAE